MPDWLDRYPPDQNALRAKQEEVARRTGSKRDLPIEARLDVHGLTADAATREVRIFIAQARRQGLQKVLIIHGKGLHSPGKAVLPGAVRAAIEAQPGAGAIEVAGRADGGSGALIVYIKSN